MSLKKENEIIKAYHECCLSAHEMELWDGEPEMYINQGWQEALAWVIGSGLLKYKYTEKGVKLDEYIKEAHLGKE